MFTALLNGVTRSADPRVLLLRVTYSDSEHPDWEAVDKTVSAILDPALGPAEQRLLVRNQIIADGQRYLAQFTAYDGVSELIGNSIAIPEA